MLLRFDGAVPACRVGRRLYKSDISPSASPLLPQRSSQLPVGASSSSSKFDVDVNKICLGTSQLSQSLSRSISVATVLLDFNAFFAVPSGGGGATALDALQPIIIELRSRLPLVRPFFARFCVPLAVVARRFFLHAAARVAVMFAIICDSLLWIANAAV